MEHQQTPRNVTLYDETPEKSVMNKPQKNCKVKIHIRRYIKKRVKKYTYNMNYTFKKDYIK